MGAIPRCGDCESNGRLDDSSCSRQQVGSEPGQPVDSETVTVRIMISFNDSDLVTSTAARVTQAAEWRLAGRLRLSGHWHTRASHHRSLGSYELMYQCFSNFIKYFAQERRITGHVTTRSMSPQHLCSPMLLFATKKLLTGGNARDKRTRRMQLPCSFKFD